MMCQIKMHLLILQILFIKFLNCDDTNSINAKFYNYKDNESFNNKTFLIHKKYSIEDLMSQTFPTTISNDIDMDPCKAGGYMGDIALPNINYENEWQQKLNKSFQQELERLKQEVYHEGLQVEEEGLTDIIRKKTKQPNVILDPTTIVIASASPNASKNLNDPVVDTDENMISHIKSLKELPFTKYVPNSSETDNTFEINATVIDNTDNIINNSTYPDNNHSGISENMLEPKNKTVREVAHHLEQNKIQSNTKDILDDSGDNIINNHRIRIMDVVTSIPIPRSTLPNRFSDTGGNGGTLENVDVIEVDGVKRKRHRYRRQFRRNRTAFQSIDKHTSMVARISRLKQEIGKPTLSMLDAKLKNKKQQLVEKHTLACENSTESPKQKLAVKIEEIKIQPTKHSKGDTNKDKKITLENIDDDVTKIPNLPVRPLYENRLKQMEHHHRITRAATAKKERIWDYGVIPYEIDGNFSGAHKALFKQAMRHWENFTCIKFVERNPNEHPNYIVFTERPCGCCSFVGKRGNGPQAISIGKNCDKFGIVVHELGHVVGFWHEHTRPDRENHVTIEKVNIMTGQEYNFNKLTEEEVNSLGLPYDYDSIMHYARNTFSRSTYLDTILPIEIQGKKRPEIGQRLRLSEGDISQANLLYKCAKCGRTFQDNSGAFTSPNYNSKELATETEKCDWRITATHGERIVLNITDLDIYKSNNCRTDYLEIRDGYWHKSPILGRFCGTGKVQELITSSGSRMLLSYVTSYKQPAQRGFAANYEAVCGGELDLETGGRLESPNYPLDYLPNKECVWKITVPKDYQVALKFQSFEVENHDNCVYDYVEIRDGDSADSRLIGVFCGYKVPPDMRSTSNKLFVKFVSDGSVQKAGFSATFMKEVDECELLDHGCEHECINTLGGYECSCFIGYELHSDKKTCENACGGILSAPNGTILSPSFPKEYPVMKECIWEIIAAPHSKITLNFTHFDLEGNTFYQSSECEYDSVTVYSKMSEDNLKRHGVYCGAKIPPLITSETNALRLEFKSDKTIQKTGFAAVFFTDVDECAANNGGCQHECKNTIGSYVCSCHNGYTQHENGHDCKEGGCKYEITAPHGQIFSPNYPEYYPASKDCIWHFTTTPGHRIRLVFNVFDIEPHQECAYDHIAMYDGSSSDSTTLGRFCGSKLPHPISSTANEMYLVFNSDVTVQRKGFFASHSTACGGYLQAANKVKHIYSHAKFGDSMYDNRADCEWRIEAELGKNVQLSFLTFEVEEEKTCSYDYVEVYGGLDDSSGPLHGKYCGNMNPPDIISLNEALLIRFRSDDSMGFKGFSASYVALDPLEEFDELNSDSVEMTPFPGSLKNIYQTKFEEEDEDGDDHNYSISKNVLPNKIHSSEAID